METDEESNKQDLRKVGFRKCLFCKEKTALFVIKCVRIKKKQKLIGKPICYMCRKLRRWILEIESIK